MVVSQNWGTPIQTPKCYSPFYGAPQKVPLILGMTHKDKGLPAMPSAKGINMFDWPGTYSGY